MASFTPKTRIGNLTLTITPEIRTASISKPGMLVPEVIYHEEQRADETLEAFCERMLAKAKELAGVK